MTKQDFELIASIIRKQKDRRTLAAQFAAELVRVNPRFHVETFLEACGCGNMPSLIETIAHIHHPK